MNKPHRIYFDLETTSTYASTARILEFASITMDSKGNIVDVKQQYFNCETPIPSSATAVNGLTNRMLAFLSNGMCFSDYADIIYKDFTQAGIILSGYNNQAYDIPVLNQNLANLGLNTINLGKSQINDVFLTKGKQYAKHKGLNNAKLATVAYSMLSSLGIRQADFNKLFEHQFREHIHTAKPHSALYDCYLTATIDIFFDKAMEV